MRVEANKESVAADLCGALSLEATTSLEVAGMLLAAGFRPGQGKAVVRWARVSKHGFEHQVVLSWAPQGMSVRAFAKREAKNGVWRRQVTEPKAVKPGDVKRLLERTLFGFDEVEQRELREGIAAAGVSYPEMRGEDVYRYLMHGKTKAWLAHRYGVSERTIANTARAIEEHITRVGEHFKALAEGGDANSKVNETYFSLGLMWERLRQEGSREARIDEEMSGLSMSTRAKCRALHIESGEGLFGWFVSGRLASAENVGPKTLDEVVGWLEQRDFPVGKWADVTGAVLDERRMADQALARQRAVAQGAVEDVVRAATKLVVQLGLDRVIESSEVSDVGEEGILLRGQLWVRKPEVDGTRMDV